MRLPWASASIGLWACWIAACGGPPASTATATDSAGIRIVESPDAPWAVGQPWVIDETPSLQIGAMDGDPHDQFFGVEAATWLPGGDIVVANGGTAEVRAFDRDGQYRWSTGGHGEAPGEYRLMTGLGVGPGDSVWVYDFGLRRFTILTTSGRVVRTVSIGASLSAPIAVGRFPDGTFVVHEGWSGRTHEVGTFGLARLPIAVARFSGTGAGPDTIATTPGREIFLGAEGQRMVMSAPLFARDAAVAIRGSRLAVGSQHTFDIALYDDSGSLVQIDRVTGIDLTITGSDIAAITANILAAEPESERAMMAMHLDGMDVPPTRPAYGTLLIDAQGYLWASDYARYPARPTTWRVLAPDGALVGRVHLPEGFHLLDVGDDQVLGVWRDDDDVEYVRIHTLQRASVSDPQ